MLFLPISMLLLSLAIILSWANREQYPFRANRYAIVIFIIQAIALGWLVYLHDTIGCPSYFGECYKQHDAIELLQIGSLVFAVCSWIFYILLATQILVRFFRIFRKKVDEPTPF